VKAVTWHGNGDVRVGIVREVGRTRNHQPGGGRPGGDPISDLLRELLYVRSAAFHSVRDNAGARSRDGCCALRLFRTLWRGPRGQAKLLRVPQAQFTHIKVPDGPSDSRFVYLSDVLPTAWQAATHTLPLDEAPHADDIFQKKQDGAVKVVLKP
jgi:threonine dehydrogenase-like Zn-dependent dehydrogenase